MSLPSDVAAGIIRVATSGDRRADPLMVAPETAKDSRDLPAAIGAVYALSQYKTDQKIDAFRREQFR
jgi:hypothetical protein